MPGISSSSDFLISSCALFKSLEIYVTLYSNRAMASLLSKGSSLLLSKGCVNSKS